MKIWICTATPEKGLSIPNVAIRKYRITILKSRGFGGMSNT